MVRTTDRQDTTLNSQVLLYDLELQDTRSFNCADALYQVSSFVYASYVCPGTPFVALGSYRGGQQRTKKQWREFRGFFIKHNMIPNGFRARV
ncbi:MAG TPA: hypothetical protein VF493_08970, partial [Terriglobales bacterium]